MSEFDLAIAGAGIVGTSAALWARMRGLRVVLIDPGSPGSGTSSGNAGTIATYACMPVNDPSVLRALPRLMFGRDSPLSISYRYALTHPRWMLSFLANCRATRSREIARHLADLLAHADAGLNPLIAEAGAEDLVVSRGQMSVWSTEEGARGAEAGLALRRSFGIAVEELTAAETRDLEPGLALTVARAVLYPEARHIRDPEALVRRLHARYTDLGGATLARRVSEVRTAGEDVVLTAGDTEVTARRAVLAAGALSGRVRGARAERLPLGCERGYHLMFAGEAQRITRPVGWAEGGFYAVPMAKGLRLAGTVEIAAPDAPANPTRLAYLARKGAEMLGPLPEPSSTWLGLRPTMPDALPAIGFAPGSDRIIHAFGHQHLGLTLGGVTGRIVADLAEGRQPNLGLDAVRPGRSYIRL